MKIPSLSIPMAWLLPVALLANGCAGTRTFTTAARAGDTVALAVGYQENLVRQNMTVTITPSSGPAVVYPPNDPNVLSVVNLYPDPVSRLVVGTETGQNLGVNAVNVGNAVWNLTQDADWWQTMMLLNLPSGLAAGPASISISDTGGNTLIPINVEILPGAGAPNLFNVNYGGGTFNFNLLTNYPTAFKTLERADRYTISFGGDVVPHSIQLEYSRTPGVGVPYVVNVKSDRKSLLWSDNGTTLKVLLTPADGMSLYDFAYCKFYVAGGVTELALVPGSLKAYDVNGNPVSGVTANIQ